MAIVINPISPVAFSVFGLDVRWYALAYVAAFLIGYWAMRTITANKDSEMHMQKKQVDDLLTWIIIGVILGGRLGYAIVYNAAYFIAHPLAVFAVWQGGMSFHGGLVGVIVAVALFAWKNHINAWRILDTLTVIAPIGFFFGRIANFINMELMGRVTDSAMGVVFNGVTSVPRHPSPLYEAAAEGVALFLLMFCLYRFTGLRNRPGALAGVFGMGYAVARIVCEQFRAPDVQIGFLTTWGLTMGQLLSLLMFVAGAVIFAFAMRKK